MERGQKEERLSQTDNPFLDKEFNKPSELGEAGAMLDDIVARLDLLAGKNSSFVLVSSEDGFDGARIILEGKGINMSDGGAGGNLKIESRWPHPLVF